MKGALAVLLISAPMLMAGEQRKFPRIVRDPVAAFVETEGEDFPVTEDEKVLEIRYDFDADGIEDLAFCNRSKSGHRGNGNWDVFLRRADGRFVEIGYLHYRMHLKVVPAKGGGSFVHTFLVGSGGHDEIDSYRITKRGIQELPIIYIDINKGGDIRRMERIFGKEEPKELQEWFYSPEEFLAKKQSVNGGQNSNSKK